MRTGLFGYLCASQLHFRKLHPLFPPKLYAHSLSVFFFSFLNVISFATIECQPPQLPLSNPPHSFHFISTPPPALPELSHTISLCYYAQTLPPMSFTPPYNKVQPDCTLLSIVLKTHASAAEFPTEHAVARRTCLVGSITIRRWCVISQCCPSGGQTVVRAVQLHSVREQPERKKKA